jgi:hypothetical protein
MTGADKTKLDGIASGATNSPFTSTAPVNVTKATAAVGTAVEAARQDHKHDVTTAAPSSLSAGGSNTEGTNTSLARSDHIHQLPAYGTGAGTICQGNDSRLADDRTTSGLRSATTVVGVSSATAPTAGQILTATSDTAATWQSPGAASTTLRQSVFAHITANTTTTSTSFVNLISQAITVGSGAYLIIHAAGAFSNSSTTANMKCRITVDGVTAGGVQLRASALNIGNSWAMVYRLSVEAGARTVALQWLTSTGTAQCRPVTNADGESASLLIEEVTV